MSVERLKIVDEYLREAQAEMHAPKWYDYLILVVLHAFSRWRTVNTFTFIWTTVGRIMYMRRVTIRGKLAGYGFLTDRGRGVITLDAFPCTRSRYALTVYPACAIRVLGWFEHFHPGYPVFSMIDPRNRAAKHTLKAAGFQVVKVTDRREVWRYG